MYLTPHFSLAELSITQVRDLDNTPPPDVIQNLKRLAMALEQVRVILGDKVIMVNSGFRTAAVNEAVRGKKNSAHLLGYAADFICPSFGSPLDICRAMLKNGRMRFDQIIEEGTWVHLSVAPPLRGEVLTKNPKAPKGFDVGLTRSPPKAAPLVS